MADEFNEFFRKSSHLSFKYANYDETEYRIPAYDMSIARLFMKMDGHMIKNGYKLVSSSERPFPK